MKSNFTLLFVMYILTCQSLITQAQSWTNLNVPSPGGNLAAIDKNSNYVYVSKVSGGIHVSSDKGSTWTTVTTNFPVGQCQLLTCTNAGTLLLGLLDFASTNGTMFPLYKSTDKGTSWTYITSTTVPQGNGTFYHSPNNTIYHLPAYDGVKKGKYSTDDGLTWTPISKVAKDIAIASDNTVYGLIMEGSALVLSKSTDKGITWTTIIATGMMAYGDRIVMTPDGNIFVSNNSSKISKSNNLGVSFTTLDSIFPYLWTDANSRIFGSKASVCALSSNGGTSWTNINTGFANPVVNLGGLLAHPNGSIYGFSNANLYKYNVASGILEAPQINAIELYPNPTSGKITVRSDEKIYGLSLFNSLGENVYESNNINQDENGTTLDLNTLAPGFYFVHLKTQKSTLIQKIVLNP